MLALTLVRLLMLSKNILVGWVTKYRLDQWTVGLVENQLNSWIQRVVLVVRRQVVNPRD